MSPVRTSSGKRVLRHKRARKNIKGTKVRPRLAVFRSLNHVYAQVIDDLAGVTLACASSLDKELREAGKGSDRQAASAVGELVAKRAVAKGELCRLRPRALSFSWPRQGAGQCCP